MPNKLTHTTQSSEKICKLQKCMKFSETSLEMFLKETTTPILAKQYLMIIILKRYENSLRYDTTSGVFVAAQILSLVKKLDGLLMRHNTDYLPCLSHCNWAIGFEQHLKFWSLKSLWKIPHYNVILKKIKKTE